MSDRYVPLRVTAHLEAGLSYAHDWGLALDGILASVVHHQAKAELLAAGGNHIPLRHQDDPVEIVDGDKWVRLEPHEGMKFSFEIAFGQAAIDATGQRIEIDFATTSYVQEIARARTFVMASEVELLRKHGLALGGSLDNAIVVDDDRVLNSDGLRYRDEFAKHKALDAIGDLYLIGHPILGAYHARKSGHHMNNLLVRAVLDDPESHEIVTFTQRRNLPTFSLDWG